MAKIKCLNCEEVFDEEDLVQKQEYMGEFWGQPAYETFSYCPFCGEDQFEDYKEEEDED